MFSILRRFVFSVPFTPIEKLNMLKYAALFSGFSFVIDPEQLPIDHCAAIVWL